MPAGMLTGLGAGLGIFKTLLDSAKALKDISDAAIRNAAIVELQEKILTAQSAQTALVVRIGELEKEVASFKAWDGEKKRYELTDFGGGTFALALKKGMEQGEPYHRLCVSCYEKGVKGLLQHRGHDAFKRELVICASCKGEWALGNREEPPRSKGGPTKADYF